MKAWAYNNLVKEYKRRLAVMKAIEVTMNDKEAAAYTRANAKKEYNRHQAIAADLKAEILAAKGSVIA